MRITLAAHMILDGARPPGERARASLGERPALGTVPSEHRPETVRRDHAADRAEDVYAVVRGSGTVVVDGQEGCPWGPGSSSR